MARLAVVKDNRFKNHKTPGTHPESPERVFAINESLQEKEELFDFIEPRLANEDEIALIHSDYYVEELNKKAEKAKDTGSLISIDPDTVMSPQTYETAKLAVGAGLNAIDNLAKSEHDSSFVAVRPPGHHALADRAMGFCLFNNVAITAKYAIDSQAFKRIFILDWDVHHGNGTQDIFYDNPDIMFASIHQHPFWPPGSGELDETGKGDGKGFNLNIPLPGGTGDTGYLKTLDTIIVPICQEFDPDLIIVSAGYDAHQEDPIASQNITTVGFAMMTQRIADLRDQLGCKTTFLLEGGYNTKALSRSVMATMEVLNSSSAEELGQVHASYIVPDAILGSNPITQDHSESAVTTQLENVKKQSSDFFKCF